MLKTEELLAGKADLVDGKVPSIQLPTGQSGLTISEIKADSDIADSLSKKHSNSLDHSNSTDHAPGSDNQDLSGKANVSHSHAQSDVTNLATTLSGKSDTGHAHIGTYESANANIQTHVTSAHAPSTAQANVDITKAEIEAKLTGTISTHSHSGGSESEVIVIKSGDTGNSTTTYADATGLSFTALANKEYMIEGWIRYTTSATSVGLKLSCNGPTTPGFVSSVYNSALVTSGMSGGGGNTYNVGAATASAQATTDNLAMLNILFKNGSTEGTFIIRFAAETTGTITIKDGSLIRYRQVN